MRTQETIRNPIRTNGLAALFLCFAALLILNGCVGLTSASQSSSTSSSALTIDPPTASNITANTATINWVTTLAATSQVNYGTTSSYGSQTTVNSTMVVSHSQSLSGLTAGQLYHYRVVSSDASGPVLSPDFTFTTSSSTSTPPPTVSVTTPAANATVSGTTTVSATASSSVGIASVQFQVDGSNVGSAVTTSPYSFSLNTATLSNANHTLTAVAKDTSNNTTTSAGVSVKVSNTVAPPTVSITAPTANATVSGTTTVSATSSSSVGIASVQFQVDGSNVGSAVTTSPYNFSLNTTTLSNATHTLTAVAKDTSNNTTTSAGVSVKVSNTVAPPTVSIMAPTANATVSATTTVSATASSSVGIASVQFQVDGSNVGSAVTTSPYNFSLNTTTLSNANHTLTAVAKDTSNNSTTSGSVTVKVSNSTAPPSVPTGLSASAASPSQINLSWTASTSSAGVSGYKVYRAGSQVGTASTTSYQDTGLTASTSYSYTVAAYDASGNTSTQSTSASATTMQASSGGGLPTSLGWYQIPNTKLQSVCPPSNYGSSGYDFPSYCPAVVSAWGGGMADTKRNRLIIWGGGHHDYSGNEVYALDLNALTMTRLNNPGLPLAGSCTEALADGSPNSRHTYDDLAYIANADQMMAVTGYLAPSGCASYATWTLNMSNLRWTLQQPSGTAPSYYLGVAATSYDPNTNLVFISNEASSQFASYNYAKNAYSVLNNSAGTDYHETSIIDPSRKLFLMFGSGQAWKIDISGNDPNYTLHAINATGCTFDGSPYPGVAFDSAQNLVVGWAGGNTVYLYNPTTDSCSPVTYTNGPGAQQANGTYKRFSYFPALNVFVLVNDATQNAYVLRLTSGSGTGSSTPPPTGPVISAVTSNSITTTGATISWTTDVASTSQVEYGTTTAYGTLTTLNSTTVTSHSQALSGLAVNTAYHYRVRSNNSSGVESISGDFVFATNNVVNTTPPTVSMTAPAANSTVTNTVTVSANASSSAGIASVQFLLDGASVGSVSSSPYSMSWNTATAANGTHTLSATATDTTGNSANAGAITVTVSNTSSTTSTTYQQRCAAAGVLRCVSLDSTSQLNAAANASQNWFPAYDGVYRCNIDPTTYPPDGVLGSLNCVVPAVAAANASGNFNDVLGGTFGPPGDAAAANGNTFYIQLRERMDSNFVALRTDGEGWKLFGVHGLNPDSTCQNVGLVIQNIWYYGMPTGFTDCGTPGLQPPQSNPGDSTSILLEQGDYNCNYSPIAQYLLPNCFQFMANQWITYEMKVVINAWDPVGTAPGSGHNTIEVWAAYEGQPLKKFINLTNFPLNYQNGPTDTYSKFILYDYDTNRSTSSAYPVSNCWYSEIVVSTQPIPAPNGPTVQ